MKIIVSVQGSLNYSHINPRFLTSSSDHWMMLLITVNFALVVNGRVCSVCSVLWIFLLVRKDMDWGVRGTFQLVQSGVSKQK